MTSIAIGLLCFILVIFSVGSLSALFLALLEGASSLFLEHSFLIYFLPLFGLLTGLSYWFFGKSIPSTKKILHNIDDGPSLMPFLTASFIYIFTVLSQLFGASTGRESTAVQFGAALGDLWRDLFEKRFRKFVYPRQMYIRSGLAAGFGAVFGVPWAGTLFALEVTPTTRWRFRYLPLCLISSFGAHWVALAWGAYHKVYPSLTSLPWDLLLFAKWSCLGLIFGGMAKIFVMAMSYSEKKIFGSVPWSWLRPAVGGLCVMLATLLLKDLRYNGLGVHLINATFNGDFLPWDFAWKSLFTVLSSASGIKGGEVTPLMAVGASLGAAVAGWISLPVIYAASLGLISVFASAAHIPWTGALMAWELFGFEAFLPTFIICWIARRIVGLHGLFAGGG